MWIEGATRAMKFSLRVLEIVKNVDSIHCLWGSAIVCHQFHRNSGRTMTGNCHKFSSETLPACHKLPISRFLIKWQIFFPSATICSRSLSRSTTIFMKSVKRAVEKLKFYSNLNLIHGKKRALKWTKSTESFIDRKQNYSNSCFVSCSLHMRLFGLRMHVIIRYYRNHVINSQFYWYTLA